MSMNSSISSGPLSANTLLFNGTTYVKAVLVPVGGTVTLYDGTSASGKVIFTVAVSASDTRAQFFDFSHMVQAKNGLFAAVSGSQPSFVYYG